MSDNSTRIPASSQTVGPFFRIGLEYLVDRTPISSTGPEEMIEIRGCVLDRDGAPVTDAMLEFWSGADVGTTPKGNDPARGIPEGFRRVATDGSGAFTVVIERPAAKPPSDAHFLVLVFARGLLRHLITRVYLRDEAKHGSDAVLLQAPPDRRATLIARADEKQVGLYWWDIVLQGANETVFFAW